MVRTHAKLLCHIGDDIRLADRLPTRDRQGLIGIGAGRKARLDKTLARYIIHRPQDRLVGDPPPPERQQEFHTVDTVVLARHFRHWLSPLAPSISMFVTS